jgi:hypothetical protein
VIRNPIHSTREQASIVLRQIEAQLDESAEADAIRNAMVPIRREYSLHEELSARVHDYENFLEKLDGLKHAYRTELNGAKRLRSSGTELIDRPKEAAPPRRNRGNAARGKLADSPRAKDIATTAARAEAPIAPADDG